ncbi:MAG: hypothetical protein ACOC1F_12675, partial [Myxococcota bacterium]
ERARWALDVCRVAYTEHGYLPLLHFAPVLWYGRASGQADRVSGRFPRRCSSPPTAAGSMTPGKSLRSRLTIALTRSP